MARTAEDVLCLGSRPTFEEFPGADFNHYLEQIYQNKNRFREIVYQHSLEGTDHQQQECLDLLSKLSRFSQQCIDLGHLMRAYLESEVVRSFSKARKIRCLSLIHRCYMLVQTGLRSSQLDPIDNMAMNPHSRVGLVLTGCSFEDIYWGQSYRTIPMKSRYSKSCLKICFRGSLMSRMEGVFEYYLRLVNDLVVGEWSLLDIQGSKRLDVLEEPWAFQDEVETLPLKLDERKSKQYFSLVSLDTQEVPRDEIRFAIAAMLGGRVERLDLDDAGRLVWVIPNEDNANEEAANEDAAAIDVDEQNVGNNEENNVAFVSDDES